MIAGSRIAIDDPRDPDVRALLERHLEFALAQTPPEHSFALDAGGLLDPGITLPSCLGNPLPPRLIFPFRARGPSVSIVVRPPVVDIADGDLTAATAVWIGAEFLEGPGKLQRYGADLIRLYASMCPGTFTSMVTVRILGVSIGVITPAYQAPSCRRVVSGLAGDSPAAPGEKLPARSPGELSVSRLRLPAVRWRRAPRRMLPRGQPGR